MEEVQGVKCCVSWEEARFIFEAIEEDLSVYIVLNQFCCTVKTWELSVADKVRLHGVEHRMMKICRVRLVDKVLTDVLRDRVSVVVKTGDMIIQSCLQWYGHVMHKDVNL